MRIRQVIRSLMAMGQLNEANDADNPAAKNTRKAAKPQGDSKRAHSKEEKKQQKPGDVKSQVVGGKGQGNEGGQIKRQVQQADKKRDREGEAAETSKKAGTANPIRQYEPGSERAKAADAQLGAVGEFDRNRKDKTKDNVRPRWAGDVAHHGAAHGLDDAQKERAPVDDMKDIEVAGGKKLKYHNPQEIERLKASGDTFDAQIAAAMEKANEEYMAAQEKEKLAKSELSKSKRAEKSKPTRDSFSQSEKEMAADALRVVKHAGRMDAQQIRNLLKNKFGLDDNGVKRLLFVMRDVHSKQMSSINKDARDELSDEEVEMGNANVATGAKRGKLEVMDMVRRSNQSGAAQLSPQEVDQLAVQAGQGDPEAQEMLFQKMARMLYGAATKYSGGSQDKVADLYGEAKAAMMQAFKTFSPEGGAGFSTWLYKNVDGLVKNASYADRNVRIPAKQGQRIWELKKTMNQVKHEGFEGVDADMEVIKRMGLASWDEYDKLRQSANMANTSSLSAPVGDDEEGDTVGDNATGGIESDWTSSETPNVGVGASPDQDLDSMQKELATKDPTMSNELMNALYDRGDVAPEARQIINSMFGIGGEEPMTDSEIGAVYGVTNYQLKKIMDTSLRGMASAIAQENGTSPEEELHNLAKILKTRKLDYRASQMGRDYDPSEDRTPEQKAEDEYLHKERRGVDSGRRDYKQRNG